MIEFIRAFLSLPTGRKENSTLSTELKHCDFSKLAQTGMVIINALGIKMYDLQKRTIFFASNRISTE